MVEKEWPKRLVSGSTIVSTPPTRHKGGKRVVTAVTALVTCGAGAGWTQSAEPLGATWSQLGSVGVAGAVYLMPHMLDWNTDLPSCAPCDRSGVPAFDRWILGAERDAWSLASTGGVGALGVVSVLAGLGLPDGSRRAAAAMEAASWAVAVTEIVKTASGRNRPVLYTPDAPGAAGDLTNQRSFPSGHAAAAFALATSLVLHGDRSTEAQVAMLLGAAGVAAMRVLARRHFPSDVVAGAAVGALSAVVVYEVRF
jgi:membrane-associated phospholipid phosphatase